MKTIVRKLCLNEYGAPILVEKSLEDIVLNGEYAIAVDGSTSNTGICIMDMNKTLTYTLSLKSDSKDITPVHYKVAFKRVMLNLLQRNEGSIKNIYYEAPILSHKRSIPSLMMLRTTIQELLIELEIGGVEYTEINNMSWKKWFLAPDKIPDGTDAQKSAVFTKLVKYMPFLKDITQDECDAICIATFAVSNFVLNGNNNAVKEKKKVRPFNFEIKFIGGDSDDCLEDLMELYNGPASLMEEGVSIVDIPDKCRIEDEVYNAIGDEDVVVILKMNAKKHGNIVLKYRLGNLASDYSYIYAIAWRTARKKKKL